MVEGPQLRRDPHPGPGLPHGQEGTGRRRHREGEPPAGRDGGENWWVRGALERVDDPVYGEVVVQNPAVKMTGTPPRVKWVCRPPGADNGYVYLKYLGLGKSGLEELAAQGVV